MLRGAGTGVVVTLPAAPEMLRPPIRPRPDWTSWPFAVPLSSQLLRPPEFALALEGAGDALTLLLALEWSLGGGVGPTVARLSPEAPQGAPRPWPATRLGPAPGWPAGKVGSTSGMRGAPGAPGGGSERAHTPPVPAPVVPSLRFGLDERLLLWASAAEAKALVGRGCVTGDRGGFLPAEFFTALGGGAACAVARGSLSSWRP
jgi:hypothetical protein